MLPSVAPPAPPNRLSSAPPSNFFARPSKALITSWMAWLTKFFQRSAALPLSVKARPRSFRMAPPRLDDGVLQFLLLFDCLLVSGVGILDRFRRLAHGEIVLLSG